MHMYFHGYINFVIFSHKISLGKYDGEGQVEVGDMYMYTQDAKKGGETSKY